MDITQLYAVAAGGLIALLGIIRLCLRTARFLRRWLSGLVLRRLIYPFLLRRHRFIGPWTRSGVLLHALYLVVIIFCSSFKIDSLSHASTRAATLSLINAVPLYFGIHMSFIADTLGISLQLYKRCHRTIAYVSTLLALFHVVANASHGLGGSLEGGRKVYGIVVRFQAIF